MIRDSGWSVQSSGIIRDISGLQFKQIAARVAALARENATARVLLNELESLGAAQSESLFDASWVNADGTGLIRSLRDALKGTRLYR